MSWRFPTLQEIVNLMRGIPIPLGNDGDRHRDSSNQMALKSLIPLLTSNSSGLPLMSVSDTTSSANAWNSTNSTGFAVLNGNSVSYTFNVFVQANILVITVSATCTFHHFNNQAGGGQITSFTAPGAGTFTIQLLPSGPGSIQGIHMDTSTATISNVQLYGQL